MTQKKIRSFIFYSCILFLSACTKKTDNPGEKILNVALSSDIKGFDPLLITDLYSHASAVQVYEGLLEYSYLKRPYELKPLLAQDLPEISKDQLTYTFKIRDNVFFHSDPAFAANPRKLNAQDIVYTFKRFADPKIKHPSWWILGEKIEGLQAFRKDLSEGKIKDIDSGNVSGLQAPDDRTLIIKLNAPDRQFLFGLAMTPTLIVASEIVKKYGDELLNHPVGTGPFILKEWKRNQKIVFTKNPNYWGATYPSEGEPGDQEKGLLAYAGQKMPFVDGVKMTIFVESQPQWLNFLKGSIDLTGVPKDAYDSAFDKTGNLKPEYAQKNIQVSKTKGADLILQVFNMTDPVLGKNKYLRKAISASMNRETMISRFYNGRAVVSNGPIPPDFEGYSADTKDPNGYNLSKAKELYAQAKALHKKQTGESELPEIIEDFSESSDSRQLAEAFALDMKLAGIKVRQLSNTWPQFSEKLNKRQIQFAGYGWNADYPDAENFLQLLYSKNASPGPNAANFENKDYDMMFERMKNLPDGQERSALIKKMVTLVHEECPWVMLAHRLNVNLSHAWLKNYKPIPLSPGAYKYYDIDVAKKQEGLKLLK